MGTTFTRLFSLNKEVRIVFLGLCGAGQTTIFNRLRPGQEAVSTTPTIGYDVETVPYKHMKFVAFDVDTQAIIYVVDSSPTERHRLVYAKEDICVILEEEELKGVILLIFVNKQDVPGALDDAAISEALELHKIENRRWAMFKACAIRGEGVFEGFDWLINTLQSAGDG